MIPQLIVALDFKESETALDIVKKTADAGQYYKVGLELFISEGYKIIPALKDMGKKVFLDLKIHDIPNTASQAILSCVKYGVDMVNVHTQGGMEMMSACSKALNEYCAENNLIKPLLIGVTLLTSLDEKHLERFCINTASSGSYVEMLALAAKEAVLDGVVSSAKETAIVKTAAGKDFLTVTPGIRPSGSDLNDQKRIVTPADAVKLGTDYIVVGRPITASGDPKGAVLKILEEMNKQATTDSPKNAPAGP